jgi:hypothetical protein
MIRFYIFLKREAWLLLLRTAEACSILDYDNSVIYRLIVVLFGRKHKLYEEDKLSFYITAIWD